MRACAARLEDLGHVITSQWVFRTTRNVDNLNSKSTSTTAAMDLETCLRRTPLSPSPNRHARPRHGAVGIASGVPRSRAVGTCLIEE
jgi:hypothetical protein